MRKHLEKYAYIWYIMDKFEKGKRENVFLRTLDFNRRNIK